MKGRDSRYIVRAEREAYHPLPHRSLESTAPFIVIYDRPNAPLIPIIAERWCISLENHFFQVVAVGEGRVTYSSDAVADGDGGQ